MDIIKTAKEVEKSIINWRRDLHQIPEIGLNLEQTSQYVIKQLEEMGIEYRKNIGVSGIVGLIKGEKPGRTIALRADMDALPIKEETGLTFASKNGNMHACGHDAHTAILLGAAKVLNENKDKIKGNVKLIFQPAEEGPGGAKPMIEDGALKEPKVDAIMGLHVGNLTENSKEGSIMISYNNMMACLDRFKLKLIGKGCHGAYPETGVDPIAMAGYFISNVQSIISRELSPTDPAVVTIGKINGGFAYNIIPDSVELEGTVRAVDQKVRENIAKRIEDFAKGISETMRGTYEYEYVFGYPPLVNDKEFTKDFIESAKKIIPEEDIVEMKKPAMGGEDMAYFLNEVPGTFFFMSTPRAVNGEYYPHHNSKFDINEEILWKGAALLIQGAMDYLEKI
ncbi:amidohydrolase [Tissierella praeacuta DSM 18095]|uniref:Amidohydrolase n=1 Tax=Tissierella praeacuta DSM 18095 TaxID=1123404 RepID=A0A1M4XMI0_9FIRM|nr:amidohydrolase [Tissierella praeacuta]SHE94463.1 amidohydrolase [Tissierella praeacuta DSM 18095]SUO99891.1 N-acyl-L-amino acid amidohydrolase [Tissierella praeacuta]